jgi:deazaflavin-dependent oxidoreductase (nitroreductase family)
MSNNRIRIFNKHITNRITRRFARFSRGPFALVRHVGRRSGKPYETPIMVEPMADGFVIALTYGESVDWYRNVLAAGHATLLWHGRDYAVSKPEPVAVQTALPLFSPFQRLILRLLGTQHFVSMQSQERVETSSRASA